MSSTESAGQHDRNLSAAFDGQAARFERAPVQSDPQALAFLVASADLPPDSLILDAGCGPGLVANAFLDAGHRVVGVDLSEEMIRRARARCERFGDRSRFECRSLYDPSLTGSFDAAVSRYVLHHVTDPVGFVRRQAGLLRPGGILVLLDHTTDLDPDRAGWHNTIEILRDHTHTKCLTPGTIVDLFASVGLEDLRLVEQAFELDFDEWFDRGTPISPKDAVRARILSGSARGFSPGSTGEAIRIHARRAIVRGVRP